jgi:DNA-binding transcriptional ArsR family regulator
MTEANITFVAGLLADPTRAAMCQALVGGEARPAGELAARAGVSAQTASNHLARLMAGRILRVEQQGRWRYYRLAESGPGSGLGAPRARHARGGRHRGRADSPGGFNLRWEESPA